MVFYALWAAFGLAALVIAGVILRGERRRYAARGQGGAWWALRLATLPIAAVAVAAVWLPARAMGGPEALALFYLLAFTAGPLVYFVLHGLVGRLTRPALAWRDSAAIAGSGLALAIGIALAAQFVQPTVFHATRGLAQWQRDTTAEAPRAHRLAEARRFTLPEIGEVWTEHWQAPPGVTLERVEQAFGTEFVRVDQNAGGGLCRSGEDVHLIWPAAVPAPRWRVFWRDGAGRLQRAEWTSAPPAGTPDAFAPQWTAAAVVLPVRLPRGMVSLARAWDDGRENFELLDRPPVDLRQTCLPQEVRPVAGTEAPTALRIGLWRRDLQAMRFATFRRPAD